MHSSPRRSGNLTFRWNLLVTPSVNHTKRCLQNPKICLALFNHSLVLQIHLDWNTWEFNATLSQQLLTHVARSLSLERCLISVGRAWASKTSLISYCHSTDHTCTCRPSINNRTCQLGQLHRHVGYTSFKVKSWAEFLPCISIIHAWPLPAVTSTNSFCCL